MDHDEVFDVLFELCKYCISDELTLTTLQEKMKKLDRFTSDDIKEHYPFSPFLHNVCLSKGVTLEIVECILDKFPYAAAVESVDEWDYHVCQDFDIRTENTYPLHLACYNQYCSTAIITLLLKRCSHALKHFAQVGYLFSVGNCDDWLKALPLHYYVAREINVNIDTVKMLLEAYPQAMLAANDDSGMCFTPLHAIVSSTNGTFNDPLHIINYLIEVETSCIRTVDEYERTPLLVASRNKNMTLDLVQFLYNAWPESIRIPDSSGYLPIHELCCNEKLGEVASNDILQFMLDIDPNLVRDRDGSEEYLPLHHAVYNMSFEFCKVLIDVYPESLRVRSSAGMLPVHHIVTHPPNRADVVDTIQYMLDLCPENINANNGHGSLIHRAAQGWRVDIVELILKYDPGAASKASRHQNNSNNSILNLPLHWACAYNIHADNVKVAAALFDAYPQAIDIRNGEGKTPLDLAREKETRHRRDPNESVLVNFLLTQQAYARQAEDIEAQTTIDNDDWLSLHCAVKDNAPLGSIKLLLMALRYIGHMVSLPLNIACEFSSIKVVRYLIQIDSLSVERLVSLHLLHSACRGGNLEVIKYFLDEHPSLVASAEVNEKGELPIQLLCEAGICDIDSDSTEYIEVIWRMLLANPEVVVGA